MSNDLVAVTLSSGQVVRHEAGCIRIEEAHLYVHGGPSRDGEVVAIYAPTTWVGAYFEKATRDTP